MSKPKKYRMRYAGSRGKGVTVTLLSDPRTGVCQACKKSKKRGEIKVTALHHWYYAYKPQTVKKNPILALENTTEFCYYCHQLADAIRTLFYANPLRVAWVAKCLRGEQRKKFIKVLGAIAIDLQKTEKNISVFAKTILEMTSGAK